MLNKVDFLQKQSEDDHDWSNMIRERLIQFKL